MTRRHDAGLAEVRMQRSRARAFVVFSAVAVLVLAATGLLARLFAGRFLGGIQMTPEVEVRLPPDQLLTFFGVPVTNTLLSSWLASLLLIGLFAAVRWKLCPMPRAVQNLVEGVLDAVLDFVTRAAGPHGALYLFPVAATFFLFIAVNAWITLLPLYGPVFVVAGDGRHFPLVRGAGTDINMSVALAILAGVVVEVSGLVVLRTSYLGRFVRLRHLLRGRLLLGVVELVAGVFEGATQMFRLLSFTFRLFGTLTAGEILLLVASFLTPLVLSVPFYGLELLIGAVQAAVFAGLTVVFAVLAMTPQESALLEGPNAGWPGTDRSPSS